MQKTIQTDQMAANIYLLYWQILEGTEITEQTQEALEWIINEALNLIEYPPATKVVFDNEGEPLIEWQKGFDWYKWTYPEPEEIDGDAGSVGAELFNWFTDSEGEFPSPIDLVEKAKTLKPF